MSDPTVVSLRQNDNDPLGIVWEREYQFPGSANWMTEIGSAVLELCELTILDKPDDGRIEVRLIVQPRVGGIKAVTFSCQRMPALNKEETKR